MPEFTYKAVRGDGSDTEGSLAARDRADALRQLASRGLQPFQIQMAGTDPQRAETGEQPVKAGTGATDGTGGRKGKIRLKPAQVILFTEELSDLLNAGVQLEPALQLMENRENLSDVGQVAGKVRDKVRDGMRLARALDTASPNFGELYCNLVSAGEASGGLAAILKRQVGYLVTLQELKNRVLTAMIYPAFLFVAGLAVTILFITFLVPRLTALMNSAEGTLPFGVRFIVGFSDFLKIYWWAVLILLFLAAVAIKAFISAPANRPAWDRLRLRIPFFGGLLRSRFHVQFLQTFGNLLANGLSLVNALKLAEGCTDNTALRKRLTAVTAEVTDGGSLHRALHKSGIFPQHLVDLVRIGEQTGKLAESIQKAGDRFDRELSKNIDRLSAMIQPVIIILIAGIIGVMAYLMVSVIYDTISVLRSR